MYLKRIELHGFKSFADKVNVEFQPGITGIVGPNGCGKSNISDAVRWVLGEQSVNSVRGANMSDVIFAGSEDRRAQNLAEVTLVFDNSDRFMKYDYNEVEITRRLYRMNNEAEYLINKQSCRLKDIIDLIMDTGLGKDSLSIISQGNISSFADNKPEERRGIFEDAAGVSKYKKRKEIVQEINDYLNDDEISIFLPDNYKQQAQRLVLIFNNNYDDNFMLNECKKDTFISDNILSYDKYMDLIDLLGGIESDEDGSQFVKVQVDKMIKYFLVPVSRGDKLSKEIVKEYIEKNAINKLEKEIENDNELELL